MGAQRKQKHGRKNQKATLQTSAVLSAVPDQKSPVAESESLTRGETASDLPAQAGDFARVLEVVQHAAPEPHETERRFTADSKGRDRRVIPRVTSPAMRNHFRNITLITRFATVASSLYLIGLFISALAQGKLALGRFIFYAVVITVMATSIQRFGSAIRSYLNSESQEKLVIVTERSFLMLFILTVLGTLMAVIHLITLF